MASRKSEDMRISEIFEELRNDSIRMRILEIMVREDRPMSAEEIAEMAGCSVFEVEKILTGTQEN